MFDLAIDSKLRGCDIVKIRVGDLVSGRRVRSRALVIQRKTGRPVQFELLEPARASIFAWLECRGGTLDDFAFPSRIDHAAHISTRQYARLVDEWVTGIGLRPEDYGTRSLRRTKASIIYKQTGNLRAVQILLVLAIPLRTSGSWRSSKNFPATLRAHLAHLPAAKPEARIGKKNGIVRQWARRGSRPRQPADQRYDSEYLFGAICPARGTGAGLALPYANAPQVRR